MGDRNGERWNGGLNSGAAEWGGEKTKLWIGGAAEVFLGSDLFCCYVATKCKIDQLCYLPKFTLPKYLPVRK